MLGVHTVRLCSVHSLGFAKMTISFAQFYTGFASLAAGYNFSTFEKSA